MASTTPYGEVLARNIRAARNRIGIGQEDLAARMRALGFESWIRQTVGTTERKSATGRRRVTAEEVFALAYALETSIAALVAPTPADGLVAFPNGAVVAAELAAGSVRGVPDETVGWKDNRPVFAAASWPADFDLSKVSDLEKLAAEFRAWKASQQAGES